MRSRPNLTDICAFSRTPRLPQNYFLVAPATVNIKNGKAGSNQVFTNSKIHSRGSGDILNLLLFVDLNQSHKLLLIR